MGDTYFSRIDMTTGGIMSNGAGKTTRVPAVKKTACKYTNIHSKIYLKKSITKKL